jgi:hypothetical protein
VLLFGADGAFVGATPLETVEALAAAAEFFVRRSAAHDPGAAFAGDDAFGVSSTLPFISCAGVDTGSSDRFSCLSADLTDFCVVDVTLGALACLMGISGTAGFVWVRVCEP